MADGNTWTYEHDRQTTRQPGPDHLGWWAVVAMLCSILLHVGVFMMLDHLKIGMGFTEVEITTTAPMNVQQVEVDPAPDESPAADIPPPPPKDAAALLEELDLIDKLPKDTEIDMKPDVLEPEFALKMTNPAAAGDPTALAPEIAAPDFTEGLQDMGRMEQNLPPAAEGQITVDPGTMMADDGDLDRFTDDLMKKGAHGKVRDGSLDGVTSLDELISLPSDVLLGKKTMLPSDLLFEFNRAELRESAKVGLMKLGLLIDRNPGLYCWVEGHTDLIGTDEANFELSRRRAAAVKTYLTQSLRMDGARIVTRGRGESQPIVPDGTAEQQGPNRRVEIRMRKELPPPEAVPVPPRATPVTGPDGSSPPAADPPPRAPVRPARAPSPPPRALPVDDEAETQPPPRARPVREGSAPRAEPVEPDDDDRPPPRAEPVED